MLVFLQLFTFFKACFCFVDIIDEKLWHQLPFCILLIEQYLLSV